MLSHPLTATLHVFFAYANCTKRADSSRRYVSTRVSAVQMQHAVDAVNTFILRMYQEVACET